MHGKDIGEVHLVHPHLLPFLAAISHVIFRIAHTEYVVVSYLHVLHHGIAALWVTLPFKWEDACCLSMHCYGDVLRYHFKHMMPSRQRRAVPRGGSLTVSKVA